MSKPRTCSPAVLAVGVLMACCAAQGQVAINDDFTNAALIGTGTGASYVAGADWTVAGGYAKVDPSTGPFGAAGTLRLGYAGGGWVGPGSGSIYCMVSNVSCAKGDYYSRSLYRPRFVLGYQDANNYYLIDAWRASKGSFGTKLFGIAKVVNGTTTWLAAVDADNWTDVDSDRYEITVTWDPANNVFTSATLVVKDSSETVRTSCTLTSVGDTNQWESGKFGVWSDGALREYDKLTFTPPNSQPVVEAGSYGTSGVVSFASLPGATALAGTATDDGKPTPPNLTTVWSKTSGPGAATFADANHVDTNVTFSQSGTYVLRLTANDGELSAYDETTIIVNEMPSVNAGADQSITLPTNSMSLNATVTDDGLPNPPAALTYRWRKVFGPGVVTFGSPTTEDTAATFTAAGIYMLELQVSDGAAIVADSVKVTVNPQPTGLTIQETFTNTSLIGTGTGANYVPGTDWVIDHGSAKIEDPSYGTFGAAGTLRVGYVGYQHVGPDNGTPYRVLYNTAAVGAGTYTSRSTYRPQIVIGYQDPNNYYLVDAWRASKGSFGTKLFGIAKVVNGTTTWLGAVDMDNWTDVESDRYEISVTWDPAGNTFSSATLTVKNSSETLRGTCSLSNVGDGDCWENGKFGAQCNQLREFDSIGFQGAGGTQPPQVNDWSEDFTSSADLAGAGTGVNYVAGANWTVTHGSVQVATTYSIGGRTGAARVGYAGNPHVGPDNGAPGIMLCNTAMGKGMYSSRSSYRAQLLVGYQDANNYYLIDSCSTSHTDIGETDIAIAKVVNNVTTWLGGAILTAIPEDGSDIYEISVDWNPQANRIKATLAVYDSTGATLKDRCSTGVVVDDIGNGDPDWNDGKFGAQTSGLQEYDKLSFTNAATGLSQEFTSSAIGTGSGGGYVAGANWSVGHGMVKQTTSGTLGNGLGIVELGQTGGVGPNNGTPHSLLSNNSYGSGQYNYRGCCQADFVFGYADDTNYYFAEVRSASRTVGGDTQTRSFAIGKVVSGTTTWLGHAGTFDTTDANAIYELEIAWDTSAHQISGLVRKYTCSGGVETLNNIESIAAFDDGNLRTSGKFGAREETATIRKIDALSFVSSFCDDSQANMFDDYGGHKGIKATKTGFFHLEKLGNRWTWISPDGHGIVPLGTALHGAPYLGGDLDETDTSRNCNWFALRKNNNNQGTRLKETLDRYKAWGFNYTGYYTAYDLRSVGVPAVVTLGLVTNAFVGASPVCGNIWYDLGFDYQTPDCYHTDVQAFANNTIRAADPRPNDPMIMAMYSDEPDYMKGFAPGHNHLGLALLVGKSTIGTAASSSGYTGPTFTNYSKAAFKTYLMNKYGAIGSLNTAWGMSYAAWSDLDNITYSSGTYGSWTDPTRAGYPAYRQDLDYGIQMFFAQWATVVKTAKEGWDNNHAIGLQLYGDTSVIPAVAAGFRSVGVYDFFMSDFSADSYDLLGGRPFMKVSYSSAENDSPLAFKGNVDSYSKITAFAGSDWLKVHVDGANYWWGRGTSGWFGNYGLFVKINGMTIPGVGDPGRSRVCYAGNEAGGGWFYAQSAGGGTVDQWITALNAMAPAKATFLRLDGDPDQETRSQKWAAEVDNIVNCQNPSGTYYRVGGEIWAWCDDGWDYYLEQRNFGLVTIKDNAYDGVEATMLGADRTAGTWDDQSEDYGDFVTGVKNANLGVYDRILGLP